MSGRVIWRVVAEEDLTEAYLYIGDDAPEAAERMLDAVGDAVALLLENPQPGSPRDFRSPHAQGIRSWAPQGFPNYLIFYKVSGDDIEVIRFLHGARDLPHHFEQDP